jgi:hypothetical protein
LIKEKIPVIYQRAFDYYRRTWGEPPVKTVLRRSRRYFYDELTADRGSAPILGPIESRVIGVGPQLGFIFPMGPTQMFLGLKVYGEFDGHDRPSGYNAWVTLAFSPSGAPPPQTQSPPLITKAEIH